MLFQLRRRKPLIMLVQYFSIKFSLGSSRIWRCKSGPNRLWSDCLNQNLYVHIKWFNMHHIQIKRKHLVLPCNFEQQCFDDFWHSDNQNSAESYSLKLCTTPFFSAKKQGKVCAVVVDKTYLVHIGSEDMYLLSHKYLFVC